LSLSNEVKTELSRFKTTKKCCKLAELSAIVMLDGNFELDAAGNLSSIAVVNDNPSVAKKVLSLFNDIFNIHAELEIQSYHARGKKHKYFIKLNGNSAPQILDELGLVDSSFRRTRLSPRRLIAKSCCAMGYLRGAFLASGSVSDSESGYHLELSFSDKNLAQNILDLLHRFNIGAKSYKRKHDYPLYIKDFESIVSFLALVGAYTVLLNWENKKIIKELKNYANRLTNCDSANANKIANASMQQISDIIDISQTVGINHIPNSLKEVALARAKFPDLSLSELGKKINPPISKSAVYHRMLRIGKLANKQ
jgi:hypothetical protein